MHQKVCVRDGSFVPILSTYDVGLQKIYLKLGVAVLSHTNKFFTGCAVGHRPYAIESFFHYAVHVLQKTKSPPILIQLGVIKEGEIEQQKKSPMDKLREQNAAVIGGHDPLLEWLWRLCEKVPVERRVELVGQVWDGSSLGNPRDKKTKEKIQEAVVKEKFPTPPYGPDSPEFAALWFFFMNLGGANAWEIRFPN